MRLPRENPKAKYDIEVVPWATYDGSGNDNRVRVDIYEGKDFKAGLSFTEQETDDLIVMLTYYKNEQFPKVVADNG